MAIEQEILWHSKNKKWSISLVQTNQHRPAVRVMVDNGWLSWWPVYRPTLDGGEVIYDDYGVPAYVHQQVKRVLKKRA